MLALVAIALSPTAGYAQFSDSSQFLKAVKDRDGTKAEGFIRSKSGSVIIDTKSPDTGESALHIVTRGRDLAWLNYLLGYGARADARDNGGNTPLMVAAQLGWTDGITLLLANRASVDLGNSGGETPLMRAVLNRDLASVRLLLAGGANPNKTDTGSGLSARDRAARDPRAVLILKAIDEPRAKPKAAIGPN